METKTFPYAVIWGGKIVQPGTPIEVKEATLSKKETVAEENAVTEKPKKGAKKNDKAGISKP